MAHTKASIAKMLASRRANKAAKQKQQTIEIPISGIGLHPPAGKPQKKPKPIWIKTHIQATAQYDVLAELIIAVWRHL